MLNGFKTINIKKINPQIAAPLYPAVNIPFTLQATGEGVIPTYQWQPALGLNNSNIAAPTAILNENQQYIVTLTNSQGCTATDSILIQLFKTGNTILVPTAFAPGGVNKVLRSIPIGCTFIKFEVYNRFEKMVYTGNNTNFSDGWNGTFNGKPQLVGAYTWLARGVRSNGFNFTLKGTAVLIR